MKIHVVLTWKMMIQSGLNFAHVMTTQPLWLVVFITWLKQEHYNHSKKIKKIHKFQSWVRKPFVIWNPPSAYMLRLRASNMEHALRGLTHHEIIMLVITPAWSTISVIFMTPMLQINIYLDVLNQETRRLGSPHPYSLSWLLCLEHMWYMNGRKICSMSF